MNESIQALIFDLDDTLIRTELLKMASYARAISDLGHSEIREEDILRAFRHLVGLSRKEISQKLLDEFHLERQARDRMSLFDAKFPWEVLAKMRMNHYDRLINDPEELQGKERKAVIDVLRKARRLGYKIGLATMSCRNQVARILDFLGLSDVFDCIATSEDIQSTKPSPDIYLWVAEKLKVAPVNCLVIEDSPVGVRAALAAGMHCIGVPTSMTMESLYSAGILAADLIVDREQDFPGIVKKMLHSGGGCEGDPFVKINLDTGLNYRNGD